MTCFECLRNETCQPSARESASLEACNQMCRALMHCEYVVHTMYHCNIASSKVHFTKIQEMLLLAQGAGLYCLTYLQKWLCNMDRSITRNQWQVSCVGILWKANATGIPWGLRHRQMLGKLCLAATLPAEHPQGHKAPQRHADLL